MSGSKLAVLRPADPQLAMSRSHALLEDAAKGMSVEEQRRRFNENLRLQPHIFVGLLAEDGPLKGRVVGHAGEDIDEARPGDVFVSYEELREKFAK